MIYAYVLDLILGDPLWFPHPVIYIGKLIQWFNKHFYKNTKTRGLMLLLSILVIVTSVLFGLRQLFAYVGIEYLFVLFMLYTSLATKSLYKAADLVVSEQSIEGKREKLSYIVSRNTSQLTEHEINKAVIETVAENSIDGIISPLFYIFIGFVIGLPVETVFLFKTVSTLDSMVGYKNEKYLNYGYFSAKFDDVLNFIPARVGSVFIGLAGVFMGLNVVQGFKVFFKSRLQHDSPNAGHAESMVAGLLNIRLGGPSTYHGKVKEKPWLGHNEREISINDVKRVMRLSVLSSLITVGVVIWSMVCMGQIANVI